MSFLLTSVLLTILFIISNGDVCPQVNTDTSNPGRCGPLFGGVRCNKDLVSYAVYCNSANGWCGTTSAHENAQADDQYDYEPSSCDIPCPPLNTDTTNPGRCGPLFGGVRCNKQLTSYAVYCNEANGWCGVTSAHENAQASDTYDYKPSSCPIIDECPSLNTDSSNGGRCGPLFGDTRCNKNLAGYAEYCNADNGWCGVTDAHKNAQADDKYDNIPISCTISDEDICGPLNTDDTNSGRCGPLFGNTRCNADLQSYAVYCNEANGWCGVTSAHENAQAGDKFDNAPTQCQDLNTCPALNTDTSNPGRCGPLFGGVRCNKQLVSYAVYCNEANGWCGVTSAHENAQASDTYDYRPSSCNIPDICPPLNLDSSNGGRCGPLFGGSRCNRNLQSYAQYCNADNGWCGVTSAHEDAQADDKYDNVPISCTISNDDICPALNTDSTNGGRCGPLFGDTRCNTDLESYAVYCNEANGWCGVTSAHENAQASDIYDNEPTQCQDISAVTPVSPFIMPHLEPKTGAWVIDLSSTWMNIIGGLFVLVLVLNILYMTYTNCYKGSSGKRKGYSKVKFVDSEVSDA